MQFRSSQIIFFAQTFQYHAVITLEEIHTDFFFCQKEINLKAECEEIQQQSFSAIQNSYVGSSSNSSSHTTKI